MALPSRSKNQKTPPRVTGPNPGAAPMATAQVTTRAATPTKAATSTPAAPRGADPRGNARPSGPNRTGSGAVNVTQSKPYVGGSDRAKAAISGAVSAVVNPANWKQGPITDAGKALGWLGSSSNPINRVGIGPTTNPNASWQRTQDRRAATSAAAKNAERVAAQGAATNRSPTAGYPAGPGMPASTGRPAPGQNNQAFRGGPTGSGTAKAPGATTAPTGGAFRGGVGGTTATPTAAAPKLPNGQPAPAAQGTQGKAPKGNPQGKPGKPGKPAGTQGSGAGTAGTGAGASPAAGGAQGSTQPSSTAPASGQQAGRPQQGPFGNNMSDRNVGGVTISMPARVDLGDINQKGMGDSIKAKLIEAGGIGKIKEGTVLTSFKGAAGVPWNVTVKGGKVVVERGTNQPAATDNALGVGPGGRTDLSGAGTDTTAAGGEASTTPPQAGQSAADYVTNQLLNNPALGMDATNNEATASLVALAAKTGLAIAGPDGAIVDPNTLLGGDPNKPFDPAKLKDYKLVLANGPSKGQAVTGENYLGMQVNPEVGGQDTSLIGTELGNLILKQKQARADMIAAQQAAGTYGGGQAGFQEAQGATNRALGYTDLTRGTIGGGLVDIQKGRQQGFQSALTKMLENPEAFGYQGATPTAPASTTPKATTPKPTDKKTFKVGEVKTWGGKQHRWNGTKWVRIGPAKPAAKK